MDKKLKIALAQLNPLVGDVSGNIDKLISIRAGLKDDVDILVAPELYVSGYPIDDLVLREDFLNLVEKEINKLADSTKDKKSAIIVGAPRKDNNSIKNSVFVIENGKIMSIKDKYELPNTGVFDEQRIFKQGSLEDCVDIKGIKFGLPICEDIWEKTVLEKLSKSVAEIIVAINASPFTVSKNEERESVAKLRVNETKLPIVYLNRTGGQDELIFDGSSFGLNHDGKIFYNRKTEISLYTSLNDMESPNYLYHKLNKHEIIGTGKYLSIQELYDSGMNSFGNNNSTSFTTDTNFLISGGEYNGRLFKNKIDEIIENGMLCKLFYKIPFIGHTLCGYNDYSLFFLAFIIILICIIIFIAIFLSKSSKKKIVIKSNKISSKKQTTTQK